MKRQIEVLAPAGSMECLKAAFLNGADAVYLGGELFGARAYAGNFKKEELCEAIDYAHLFGKKVFLTINTLVKEEEMSQLPEFLKPYYEQGLDAVIIQDFGVLETVRKHFPDLEIHGSTQMTITGVYGAKMIQKLGAKRVVPARELSLEEIKEIKDQTGLDMECFVHGALCYCYSGQCLMSSMLGGRSGNRGRCAGTCRLPFEWKGHKSGKSPYPLSLKDLCTIEHLPEIIEHGVDSLKIEGRMKGPRYVGEVTRIYRKYVDLYLSGKPYIIEEQDQKILMELFNRGGFTDGYYKQYHGKDMMSMKRPNHQGISVGTIEAIHQRTISFQTKEAIYKGDILEIQISPIEKVELTSPADWKKGSRVELNAQKMRKLQKGMKIFRTKNAKLTERVDQRLKEKYKENLKGKITLHTKEYAKLWIDDGKFFAEAKGPLVEQAQNQGASVEQVRKQLLKTGETHYNFSDLEVDMEPDVFVPVSVLKRLRREAMEALDQKKTEAFRRVYKKPEEETAAFEKKNTCGDAAVAVSMEEIRLLPEVLKTPWVDRVYLSWQDLKKQEHIEEIFKTVNHAGKECFIMLPQIARKKQMEELRFAKELLFSEKVQGLLVRNLEEYEWLLESGYEKQLILDYMMYGYNKKAQKVFRSMRKEATRMTYPVECNQQELKALDLQDGDLFFYGYLPLMVSAQCVKNNLGGCNHQEEWLTLTDRYQKDFYVRNYCDGCFNEIYNGQPIWLGNEKEICDNLPSGAYRIHFTKETLEEAQRVLDSVKDVLEGRVNPPTDNFTKGHLKRGIL